MIPSELKQVKQWIVWKSLNGKDKQPHSAITMKMSGWQQPNNWATFDEALMVCKKCNFQGIGFVFKFPYVGIDLDDCIEEDGMMNDLAKNITDKIDTFTEYSKSGKGLHLYCKVTEPVEVLKTEKVEIYGEGRFFIVTGKELDSIQDQVTDQTENIKELLLKYKPKTIKQQTASTTTEFVTGERNNRMTSEIGRMFNFWDKAIVFKMAHELNKAICKPPLEDKEIDSIVESMSKRELLQIPPKQVEPLNWEHIEGKRNLDEKPYKGISKGNSYYVSTGIETIDYALNDLSPGRVTLIAGRQNGGKSTFVKQIMANAIDSNNKVFLISGEGDQEVLINELYQCVIGRNTDYYDLIKVNRRWHKEPKPYVLKALEEWHRNKLTIFSKRESKFNTTDELFTMIELEVKENKNNLIIIDNLMSILTAKATEKNEAQAEFMQRCSDLANIYKTHIILVLHPNKEYRKGQELDVEQISGTSDLGNKADNVIAVIREYNQEKIDSGINGKLAVIKNRYYPNLPIVEVNFDSDTGLLLEIKDGQPVAYNFKWLKYLDNNNIFSEVEELSPWDKEE